MFLTSLLQRALRGAENLILKALVFRKVTLAYQCKTSIEKNWELAWVKKYW